MKRKNCTSTYKNKWVSNEKSSNILKVKDLSRLGGFF